MAQFPALPSTEILAGMTRLRIAKLFRERCLIVPVNTRKADLLAMAENYRRLQLVTPAPQPKPKPPRWTFAEQAKLARIIQDAQDQFAMGFKPVRVDCDDEDTFSRVLKALPEAARKIACYR